MRDPVLADDLDVVLAARVRYETPLIIRGPWLDAFVSEKREDEDGLTRTDQGALVLFVSE